MAACGDDSATNNASNNQQNTTPDSAGVDAGSDMAVVDMATSDMATTDMSTADMSNSDLGGADMSTADMSMTDMPSTDMSSADMSSADMADESDASMSDDAGADMGPESCEPYTSGACGAGEKCHPEMRDATTGKLVGSCVPAGSAQVDDACDVASMTTQTTCDDGLFCSNGVCVEHCDPQATSGDPGTCTFPSQCAEVGGPGGTTADWGYCADACDPFAANACASGEKCFPEARGSADDLIYGTCGTGAAGQTGDPCDGSLTQVQCGQGLICAGDKCTPICDPMATVGAGTCGTNQACADLFDNAGNQLLVGSCIDTCGYNHGDPGNPTRACADSSEVCRPGELIGETYDYCRQPPATTLAPGDDCTSNGLMVFDECGINSLCLTESLTGSVLCYDMCITSEGAFGTSPHPDCRDTNATCTQVVSTSAFGACQ